MRATIDKAGRLVIPKPLRDHLGLGPGEVEVIADGAGPRVEPLAGDSLDDREGRLVIPAGEAELRFLRERAQSRGFSVFQLGHAPPFGGAASSR